MDHNENIHLKIAKFLLNNREVAKMLATAIDTALEAMDAHIQREILRLTQTNEDSDYVTSLINLKNYWEAKYNNEISSSAGVQYYNPYGCEGEQIYKFIQEFTGNKTSVEELENYSQEQFNAITDEDYEIIEDYYTEKSYHEFTASGGCLD